MKKFTKRKNQRSPPKTNLEGQSLKLKGEYTMEIRKREDVLKHLYVGLQRKSSENIVKRTFMLDENIEKYLWIQGDVLGLKVNETLLKKFRIPIEFAWNMATENTKKDAILEPIDEILSAITGITVEHLSQLYVLTNTSGVRGAASIINDDILITFAKQLGTNKIIAIPSSIHEFLLFPYNGEDIEEVTQIVKEVNRQEVDIKDQLADKAYIINLEVNGR